MKLNEKAMKKLMGGQFSKIEKIEDMFNLLADNINNSNADSGEITLSFHKDEKGLIPEIIIRVRKPEEDSDET